MKNNKITLIVVLAILGVFFLVTTFLDVFKSGEDLPEGTRAVTVKEVIQTNNYTYVNVEEKDSLYWIAITSADLKKGDRLYFSEMMEMENFKSRELDRTFESIFFVNNASTEKPSKEKATEEEKAQAPATPQKPSIQKWENLSIETPQGGITLAQLFENPTAFEGKSVTIRGAVTRFNAQIMNKNWIHIQDGTEFNGDYDLTITTLDTIEVGQEATFTGTITLNKDFGYGYAYDVLLEDAKIINIRQ